MVSIFFLITRPATKLFSSLFWAFTFSHLLQAQEPPKKTIYTKDQYAISKYEYTTDSLEGFLTKYDLKTGYKFLEAPVKNGLINGIVRTYWLYGIGLREEFNVVNNKMEGIYKFYLSNGKLLNKKIYKSDTLIGLGESFYYSGRVAQQYWHNKGVRTDSTIWYSVDGKYSCHIKYNKTKPMRFHLKNIKNNTVCSWDIQDFLSSPLKNYDITAIETKKLFSKERLWIGFVYKNYYTNESLEVFFTKGCNLKKKRIAYKNIKTQRAK